jgi:hypothetical protein
MRFRTEIKLQPKKDSIDYKSHLVLLGSCFSENMESKFDYFKFDQFTNPFGIIFQPKAIEKALNDCIDRKEYLMSDLLSHNDVWLSLNHHSAFNQRNAKLAIKAINEKISLGHLALKKATHLIITLGTAWAYRWKENDSYVANCHKIPQSKFIKHLLSSEEISESLGNMIHTVKEFNKDVQIIFTVSPVRHLKDGFTENNLSKALLLKAVHEIEDHDQVHYFPSYEIMMDDLRDYRFYKRDLVHPNEVAVDYIWELFKNTWIGEQAQNTMKEVEEIQSSLLHKAFDPESERHQAFLDKLEKRIQQLNLSHPEISFNKKRK